MDEADRYRQRLEAIAEKLQLQEEQERARREVEEERLRLQQLKRKSLRDQWLMEGAPLSPASSDTQSPRSPLWDSEAQEMEEHTDQYSCGLQSESQQLTEEEEKEPMENREVEAAEMEEAGAESSGDGVGANQSLLPDKSAMAGTGLDSSDSSQSFSRGLMAASASGDGLRMAVYEGGPAPNPGFSAEEEETAAMIAEHAIVAAGEDEEPEVIEGQLKGTQSETDQGSQEAVGEEIKRETAGETSETTQQTAGTSPTPAGGEEENNPVPPVGVTVVSTVPVYSQSNSVSEQEAEGSAAATPEEADGSLETKEPPTLPGQFQEVFLVDPENDKWMEGVPGEQDSLLPQAKAPDSHTEPAAGDTSASTETRSPNRASRKEKSRASLCCSVM